MIVATAPVVSQTREVNLTGRPLAAISEPFTQITGLEEVAPGKVVISDLAEQRLVLADLGADAVRNVSRRGGGPGEWQLAMGLSRGPRGTVYVTDPQLRKVHVVDADGRITSTQPFPGGEGGGAGVSMMAIPRGTDARGRLFFTGAPFVQGQTEQPDSIPILRWDPATRRADTIAMVRNELRITQSGSSGGSMRVMARVGSGPLTATSGWVPLPDGGAAIIHPDPYRVDFADATGRLTRGTPVPFTPIRVTAAERDAERERRANQTGMAVSIGGGGGSSVRSFSGAGGPGGNAPPLPDSEFPATMGAFVGSGSPQVAPSGEVWILRARAAKDPTPTYDIFAPTGRLVGKATLRPHSQVVGFGQGVVYVARQDPEDDLRYVEQYALR
jgi:hypothetical protein